MFIEERYNYILDLLNQDGKVLVKDLSKIFNVSESMIRKDLQILERKKLLKRTYGGAIKISHTLVSTESFQNRVVKQADSKEKIAYKAADEICAEDVIFLDASTTSYMIAKLLIHNDIPITLITNMIEISTLIPTSSHIRFIFIGGDYNPFVGGSIGSYAINQINGYRCNKAFIGCNGVDLSDGSISSTLSEDASTKKAIMQISKALYLVMTNDKFETTGSYTFSNILDFNAIITEASPHDSIRQLLDETNIKLL